MSWRHPLFSRVMGRQPLSSDRVDDELLGTNTLVHVGAESSFNSHMDH